MILDKIIDKKLEEIKDINIDKTKLMPSDRDFFRCVKGKHNIIAELKRSSPSSGAIRKDTDIKKVIKTYDRYANAISVVTDNKFFDGNLEDIKKIKKHTKLPILRKDFIIDKSQIYESRCYGADAILIIARILSSEQIDEFIKVARKLNMDCLVEVHSEGELLKVLKTDAKIIGINNRDLDTFDISLDTTKRLKNIIPDDKIIVSESGLSSYEDIIKVDTNSVLIGTSLMISVDISNKLRSLRRPKVKICGITNIDDAKKAIEYGADFIGFNFYPQSPRCVDPDKARSIIRELGNNVTSVGVFVDPQEGYVERIIEKTGIDMLQFHGNETPEFCDRFKLPLIKSFNVNNLDNIKDYDIFASIIDSYDDKKFGGTGEPYDYDMIKNVYTKIFIAGGVSSENVDKVLRLDPYCIDICSSVEKDKVIKDHEKMKEFIEKVKNNEN